MTNPINWFPGHIAKALKELKSKIGLVDVVIELRDARLPLSSKYDDIEKLINNKPRLIVLTKSDLVEKSDLDFWINYIKKVENKEVLGFSINDKNNQLIFDLVLKLTDEMVQKRINKGMLPRATRVLVLGMPNVGKSSFINKIVKKNKATVGAKAGVTRQLNWIRINSKIELLDTPGIIPFKLNSELQGIKLSFVNSIGENAYDYEIVARSFLDIINTKYPGLLNKHYNLENQSLSVENIAHSRNLILKNASLDIKRTSVLILTDFRNGKLGKLILD